MYRNLFLLIFLPFISNAQIITTFAGNGTAGFSGDGTQATAASINQPAGVAFDGSGNVYLSDYSNNRIRKVSPAGVITTVAGTGIGGYTGDGAQATNARLNNPNKIAVDPSGNLFIADFGNNVVRKVSTTGVITTIAGTGMAGFNGDGIPATSAKLNHPCDVAFDHSGNIYIADYSNFLIRKISGSGIISTYVGTGTSGSAGDGGPATAAQIHFAYAMIFDPSDNLYFADAFNNKIRKVTPSGMISTYAGTGSPGYSGDGGSATAAQLSNPAGVALDAAGNLYIADDYNNRIRKVTASGTITSVTGNGTAGFMGDGGSATAAEINQPDDVAMDNSGNLYISDNNNNRVRRVSMCVAGITHQPSNDTVFAGTTAKYWVATTMPSPLYQWQQNAGPGFVDLANAWPYSGVTTDTLTIHNASMFIDTTHYRCVITNGSPCGDTSSSAILYIRSTTGLSVLRADMVSVYPNPAHDNITITLPFSNVSGSIQIINEIGQLVSEQKITGNSQNITLNNLVQGVYILRIHCNDQVVYKKVVKN